MQTLFADQLSEIMETLKAYSTVPALDGNIASAPPEVLPGAAVGALENSPVERPGLDLVYGRVHAGLAASHADEPAAEILHVDTLKVHGDFVAATMQIGRETNGMFGGTSRPAITERLGAVDRLKAKAGDKEHGQLDSGILRLAAELNEIAGARLQSAIVAERLDALPANAYAETAARIIALHSDTAISGGVLGDSIGISTVKPIAAMDGRGMPSLGPASKSKKPLKVCWCSCHFA